MGWVLVLFLIDLLAFVFFVLHSYLALSLISHYSNFNPHTVEVIFSVF